MKQFLHVETLLYIISIPKIISIKFILLWKFAHSRSTLT